MRSDRSYNGIFFVGVWTTGIFCRPTCRAKKPRPENVEYFTAAAEALHAGYRPCRPCHPLDNGHQPSAGDPVGLVLVVLGTRVQPYMKPGHAEA